MCEDFIEKITKQYGIEVIIIKPKGRPNKDGKERNRTITFS